MFEAIANSVDSGEHNLVIQLNAVTEENDRLALHGMSKEDFAALRSGQLARQAKPLFREYSIEIATR